MLTSPLTVTFAAVDPSTGQASGIVTISPAQVTIPAGQNASNSVQTVTLNTPTGTGTYAVVLSAPGLTSVTSSSVTVTPPSITAPNSAQTLQVGAGMHRDFIRSRLTRHAPSGGLIVSLSSADTSKFTVPATVTVPASSSSVNFTLTGVASTHDQQGQDHPVTLTLTAPQPWIGSTSTVSVTAPVFSINNLLTPRTMQSAPDPVTISVFNPACNCNDVLNAPLSIGLSIQSTTSGIATVSPATVTIPLNSALSPQANISTPTTAPGTYTLIVSANGFTTLVSTVVTVQ